MNGMLKGAINIPAGQLTSPSALDITSLRGQNKRYFSEKRHGALLAQFFLLALSLCK